MKKEIKDEIKHEAPHLAGLSDKFQNPVPPKGYFEEMQDQVIAKTKRSKVISLKHYMLATAAAILLGGFFFLTEIKGDRDSQNLSWENVTEAEMKDYLLANIDDYDYDLLTENIDENADIELFDEAVLEEYILENIDQDLIEYEIINNL